MAKKVKPVYTENWLPVKGIQNGMIYAGANQKITGVNTAFFCHNERFICCTRTKDDALKIAELAINS